MRLDSKSMTSEASDFTQVIDDSDPEDLDEWEEGRDHDLEKKKERLIRRLIRLVGQDDGQKPFNVAIIGPMGVGKSSFVNTMAAALSGERWREYAYTGSHGGEGSQITVFTTSYPKCCVANNTRYADVHLPKFVDIAGFNDEDGENWVELLRIVFYGRLPEGESLAEAVQCLSDEGLKGLIRKYSSNNEMLKIDRIIFVSASTTPVPTKLINAVITAARPSGSSQNPMKRTIPIFGVMTKEDKVGGEQISQSDFVKREQDFINALGLAGSKHRYLCCRNYCDDVDPEQKRTMTLLPDLDIPALKFMMQVSDPVIQVGNKEENYSDLKRTSPKGSDCQAKEGDNSTRHSTAYDGASSPTRQISREKTKFRASLNEMGLSDTVITLTVISIEAVLVAFLLNLILRPTVDMVKLKGACNFARERNGLHGFESICRDLELSGGGTEIARDRGQVKLFNVYVQAHAVIAHAEGSREAKQISLMTAHTTDFDEPVMEHWFERKIAQTADGSTEKNRSDV